RWPSLRRAADARMFAAIAAMIAVSAPGLGPMLFYRPYTGNYVYGLVISLAFAVPYRLFADAPRAWGWWWSVPVMLVLGVAAGLSNEHTAPTFAGIAAFSAIAFWRRGNGVVPWAVAGLLGALAGGIALLVAPGQEIRYAGLATQQTMWERLAGYGVYGT